MEQLLFALVVSVCPAHEVCKDVIYEVYDTRQECEKEVFEKRIFNGNCYPVEKIIHSK
ncbi:DUF1482 family protein [Yersinia intermedia]|uniref:DUF1482 family protein n=1 Tax=Yersinia intermedia TaxID=631 RepID=UPI001CFED310|nr:DUF1482 family protein [Yersinia intermedia]MCB5312119.1 YebW family protein [Yersinia intermedia]MCB5326135.1 YebW family protein [Yersinia intermedia]